MSIIRPAGSVEKSLNPRGVYWRLHPNVTESQHALMQGVKEQRWMELCRQAVRERDPDQLMRLIDDINRMLYEKEQRLKQEPTLPARKGKSAA